MQKMIQFLIKNLDVLSKVKEGKASLVGVSAQEQQAILQVFSNNQPASRAFYWK